MRPCGLHLKVLVRPGCSTTNVPMPYARDCCESSWRTSRLSRFRFTCFKPGAGGCPQRLGLFSISRLSASGAGSHRFECAVFSRHEGAQLRPKKLVAYVRCLPELRPSVQGQNRRAVTSQWKNWSDNGHRNNSLGQVGKMLLCVSPWRQTMEDHPSPIADKPNRRSPWNKGKIVGAKPPLRPSHQVPPRAGIIGQPAIQLRLVD